MLRMEWCCDVEGIEETLGYQNNHTFSPADVHRRWTSYLMDTRAAPKPGITPESYHQRCIP